MRSRARLLPWLLTLACLASPAAAQPLLDYVEVRTGGARAGEALPLVIALHGMGDRPEHFAGLLRGLPLRARVILPRAPLPRGKGWSWYRPRSECRGVSRAYGRGIEDAVEAVAHLTRHLRDTLPRMGDPVVTGFSQGGLLSFLLAVRHPELWAAAVPIAGEIPTPLRPRPPVLGTPTPPIRALHGQDDRVFPLPATEAAVHDLRDLGFDATLQAYPGLGHATDKALRAELFRLLGEALAPPRQDAATGR